MAHIPSELINPFEKLNTTHIDKKRGESDVSTKPNIYTIDQHKKFMYYMQGISSWERISLKCLLDMDIKDKIKNFCTNLKNRIKEINSVYYLKEDDTIKLYTFIEDDDIKVKKEIIDANLKLWDRFNNYLFDFGVHPKKFINSYELEKMEKIL